MYRDENITTKVGLIPIAIILYYSVSPFLYLLRALYGDADITAIVLRTSQPVLMLLTTTVCIFQGKFKLNAYSFTLLLLGVYGLSMAVFQENKMTDFIAGYLHFMTGIILFIYFYNSHKGLNVDKFIRILSYAALACYSIVLALLYSLNLLFDAHIYLGLACQVLIIVFFYNFQTRRFFLCFLTLFLIIVSGKRGVFVALFAGIFIAFLTSIAQLEFKRSLKIFFGIAIVALLTLLVLPQTGEKLMDKYIFSENETIDDYSAGRWNEVISAYDGWSANLENMVLGSGFGFTYSYVHFFKNIADTEAYKNVHFSYLNPIIIFGVPVSSIYFMCIFFIFIRVFRNNEVSLNYMRISSITYLIYACFVFDLFDEPIFWMINGYLFNSDHVNSKFFARKTPKALR